MRMMVPVPPDDAAEGVVMRFAHSYDGYAAHGTVPELGKVVRPVHEHWKPTGELPDDLDLLRACLFFAVRAHRFTGASEPFTADPFVMALLRGIRMISGGSVELTA
jgi:hypothetical protein